MSEFDATTIPEYLSPAALGEYISYGQCARFAKHRIQEVEATDSHEANEFREAFEPLNILFSAAGDEFETDITTRAERHTRETVDLTDPDDDDVFRDTHADVLHHIRTAVQAEASWEEQPIMLYQASLVGSINGQGVRGDSDNIFIWSTADGAEVRVIDIKRTTEEKVYHQVQAAAYAAILRQLIERSSDISAGDVSLSGGVITQETSVLPLTRESIPSFDVEPRIADIHRLVESGSQLMTALRTDEQAVDFQLDNKCGTCPYNEGCVTELFEQGDIRLLGLTVSRQQTLREHGVETLAEVAALGRTPDNDQWRPTEYPDVSFPSDQYKKLARTPGIGELLPHLVYRAEAMLDALQRRSEGISDRPQNWLPGSGRCSLPDDAPSDEAPGTHDFQHGSMVRVYLNVQYDHLRDRLVQLSARVTATATDSQAKRISVVSEGASEDTEIAHEQEATLFRRFITDLFEAIHAVADELSLESAAHDDPPVHFYLYTQQEYDTLIEAFDRHNEQCVGALRSALEGIDQPDDGMVSILRPEVQSHVIMETPSPGLLHAYQELHPGGTSGFSKARDQDSWSYSPPESDSTYDLRHVFSRRLFDIGASASYPDGDPSTLVSNAKQRLRAHSNDEDDANELPDRVGVDVHPGESDRYKGINTRMRLGASIPLAYLWAAVGRIDEQWATKDSVDESALAEFELNQYRYRDNNQDEEITLADVRTLGRHLCDVLEHVERSLQYRDSLYTKAPYPLDSLETDTFELPTLAEGAEQYLVEEYEANREEKYQLYRNFPVQRILSGESIPVYVTDVEERNQITLEVEGVLRYDDQTLFGDGADRVKRACRQKGGQGTSSGSWMVANAFRPGRTNTETSQPYKLEKGANATVEYLDTDSDRIRISLRNFWNDGGDFGQRHAKWTTDSDRSNSDDRLYVESGEWLILDPQTDDLTAERVQRALDHADTNALHQRLEAIRHGQLHDPTTPLFTVDDTESVPSGPDGVEAVATWLRENVDADTYPSEQQQRFITETTSQVVALQGPPGTGKTAATMAPALLARLYGGARNGVSVNGLVTAPSNTAIDEVLADTADLLAQAEEDGPLSSSNLDIELVRIGEEPADPIDGVTYANYNNDDHDERVRRVIQRLQTAGSPPTEMSESAAADAHPSETEVGFSVAGDEQSALSAFNTDEQKTGSDGEEVSEDAWTTDTPLTLVFATTTRSWRFLKELASGSSPDDRAVAEQQLWHLLAVDEASMLELPNFLLAGSGFREDGQVLVGGDHRQLPPVQKRDWDDVRRRDIRSTVAHLSTLDYVRFLRGDDVLDEEHESWVTCKRDPEAMCLPLVQLDTTYRFDEWTAQFMQQTIYEKDGIPYTSGRSPAPVPAAESDPDAPFDLLFSGETTVALLTYDGKEGYKQWNPIESVLTEALIMATEETADVGVVTPHNAQRGRVQSLLQERGYAVGDDEAKDGDEETVQDIQVETVNRFQGGERDLMAVNATVSDPNYIAAEEEFLLTENRINVSFTRHRDLLVVLAPEALLGYLPDDPDLYDQACLWKTLAMELGESPGKNSTNPDWEGNLKQVLAAVDMQSVEPMIRPELATTIRLYTNTSREMSPAPMRF
ncbi:bifunctional RecB family nuclease/DEAD/DEAH box helicase [Natranaeroarchaeum sulfidigenes]|uniref:Superfamily I DNA/RNA helicase fused to RecB family endonuclease n=1 Tax=Natranaeroarchaeum sulfidigenes TaxID=2784880 RepID=A0A897MRC9_9EURY|nr:bifunctional RecB family nuclease/DEAD/DEAH box helicase [Natranaeroarchaeum sulfidigenes]QSG02871.1 Superfamily I DNA/RNA helicase fused to RecB family endonuclease [Natranaeroarchaeum sulfidigenes]